MFASFISPDALKMMLKGFGLDVDPIILAANEIIASGKVDCILKAAETLERIEKKLDSILQIETEKKNKDGEP